MINVDIGLGVSTIGIAHNDEKTLFGLTFTDRSPHEMHFNVGDIVEENIKFDPEEKQVILTVHNMEGLKVLKNAVAILESFMTEEKNDLS